jgi:hypothetical protein
MHPKPTTAAIQQLRNKFLQIPLVCAGAIVCIHIIPKDPGDHDIRLVLTLAYFAAWLGLLYTAMGPREEYMRQWFAWRYEDSGPTVEQIWRLYLSSLSRCVRVLAGVAMVLVACTAVEVLMMWPEFSALNDLDKPVTIAWWGSLIGLGLLPIFGGNLFSEVFQRARILEETVETSQFKPRTAADLQKADQALDEPAVMALEDHSFRAGGFNWYWEDFYKNGIIFGQSGTGKTLCVLNALVDGLLSSTADSAEPPSGLILDPKGDFLSKIGLVCRKYGRDRDLLVLNPKDLSQSIYWNPFDSDDDALEISGRFAAVLESTGMEKGGDSFWIDSARKFIRYAIELLRLSNPPDQPPDFSQINRLSVDMKAISRCFDNLDDGDPRWDGPLMYFNNEWMELPPETRNSIMANLTNMIDPFLMAPYNTLFSGQSTKRVADMVDEGKILYVYMPIADRERMSRVICTFLKLEFYREVLKRPNKARSSFFLCDEFQAFFTSAPGKGDSDFFERSRQSNHANVIATQNYPALLKAANDRESVVKNLVGNCGVKVFLRNTDESTNKFAAELFGQTLVTMIGSGLGAAAGRNFGGSSSTSTNRQFDYMVRMEEFINLAVPARADGIDYTESIVHLASRAHVSKEKLKWKVHPLTE